MAEYKITLDIGSQFMSAGLSDGVSVKIPSVAVVENKSKKILATGVAALNYVKNDDANANAKLVYPILEGAVVDGEVAAALFVELFSRILPYSAKIFSQVKVFCTVHSGLLNSDKKNIESILLNMGARQVSFVVSPLSKSVGLFREFHVNRAIVADLGAECADIAIVCGDQIVSGCTLYQSGKALTRALQELIRRKYLVKLSEEQAEELKINCASLFPNDISTWNVSGTNLHTGRLETLNIASKEAYDTVAEHAKVFCKIVESLLNSVPDQVNAAVKQSGVLLCGGAAKLQGLDSFLSEQLCIPVHLSNEQ